MHSPLEHFFSKKCWGTFEGWNLETILGTFAGAIIKKILNGFWEISSFVPTECILRCSGPVCGLIRNTLQLQADRVDDPVLLRARTTCPCVCCPWQWRRSLVVSCTCGLLKRAVILGVWRGPIGAHFSRIFFTSPTSKPTVGAMLLLLMPH